jgi:hypothetical protein
MSKTKKNTSPLEKRWTPAPGNDSQTVNGAVLGAFVDAGERVEWVYTVLPDGSRIVTGYDILPILSTPQNAPQSPTS